MYAERRRARCQQASVEGVLRDAASRRLNLLEYCTAATAYSLCNLQLPLEGT